MKATRLSAGTEAIAKIGANDSAVLLPNACYTAFTRSIPRPGALASWSGWQTISTRVGPAMGRALLSTLCRDHSGSVTRQLLTPKAAATAA